MARGTVEGTIQEQVQALFINADNESGFVAKSQTQITEYSPSLGIYVNILLTKIVFTTTNYQYFTVQQGGFPVGLPIQTKVVSNGVEHAHKLLL